ncbi:hypothetical protein DVH05_006513 [Phytophthora capsici]|nr:hypothetical protein DVH05_006513 [Phytophthora capsici]
MEGEEYTTMTLLLCMGEALAKYEQEVADAREEIYQLMIKEEWRASFSRLLRRFARPPAQASVSSPSLGSRPVLPRGIYEEQHAQHAVRNAAEHIESNTQEG